MKYRILGKTGMKVSVVGLGTWQFGGEWGKDFEQNEVDAMFSEARDQGINFVDTAECYGDHLSESFVGKAIEKDRDSWVVATKFGHSFTGLMKRGRLWKPEDVQRQLEDSLRALRTDHVDLYQFHSGSDEEFQTEGLWEFLQKQVEAGKVRHLGISVSPQNPMRQVDAAESVGAETIQVIYNRLDRSPEEDVFPSCRRQELGVLARVPLASGFLSGKYNPGDTFPKNDVRGGRNMRRQEERLKEVRRIAKEEVPDGVPMARWALAWCLRHPAVTCVIPGCKTVEQVRENAAASELDMVSEEHPQAAE